MLWSQMLVPTLRDAPKDVDRPTAILSRAGYAFVSGGRLTAFLPLGAASLDRLKRHFTARLAAEGGEEIALLFYQPADVSGPGIPHVERRRQAGDVSARTDADGLLWQIAARHVHSYNQLPRLWLSSAASSCGLGGCFTHCMSLSLHEATRETSAGSVQRVFSELTGMLGLPVIRANGLAVVGREEAAAEFLCISPYGEVEMAHCPCGYAANLDCAISKAVEPPNKKPSSVQPRLVETPGMKTIAAVADYLGIPASSLIKSLLYIASGRPVLVLVRGDDQLNEHLLHRALGSYDPRPANPEEIWQALGADPGSIGPVRVQHIRILADYSIRSCHDMASGANKDDYHLTGVEPERDFRAEYIALRQVVAGDACPECGQPLVVSRARLLLRSAVLLSSSEGLAQLRVLGPDNKPQPLLATSHRIDLCALLLTLVEGFSNENGLVLPPAVSPFDVLITPVRYNDPAQRQVCDSVYGLLGEQDLRVLIDDRDVSPGVKFKDADLIGIPLRVTIGPKKLSERKVELRLRATGETFNCPIEDVAQSVVRIRRSAGATDLRA